MSKESAYLVKLSALTKAQPTLEHLDEIERELYGGASDRATAILCTSYLDNFLKVLIEDKLRKDLNSDDRGSIFGPDGFFGTFSSKIVICYALQLIGPVIRNDLNLMRVIRNSFAHSRVSLAFKTPEIKAVCDHLKIVDDSYSNFPIAYPPTMSEEEKAARNDKTEPRKRFLSAFHDISYRCIFVISGPRNGDIAFKVPLP